VRKDCGPWLARADERRFAACATIDFLCGRERHGCMSCPGLILREAQ